MTGGAADTPEGWALASEDVDTWQRFWLAIDTDAYAGSFSATLCAACTGQLTARAWGSAFRLAHEHNCNGPALGPAGANLVRFDGRNYGTGREFACVDIAPTPGSRATPTSGDEYNTVRIFLVRPPTPEEFDGIRRRALAFAARGYELEEHLDPKPFKILGFRLLRERTITHGFAPKTTPTGETL